MVCNDKCAIKYWTRLGQFNVDLKSICRKLSQQLEINLESHVLTEEILEPRTIESKTASYRGRCMGRHQITRWQLFVILIFLTILEGYIFVGVVFTLVVVFLWHFLLRKL